MEGLEDELTCPVCLELYTCPLLLPCHHNLCRRCAEAFLETPADEPEGAQAACSSEPPTPPPEENPGSFACPTCREEVRLGDRGVDGLGRNQMLCAEVHYFQKFKQIHAQSQLKRSVVACLVCDATPPRDAVKSCTTCKLSYCGECLKLLHPSRGGLSDHKLVKPVEAFDEPQKTVMCPDHKNKPVELYCKLDKAPVCCLCKLVGKHKEHDVAALEEVYGGKKENLQQVVEEMEGNIEEETTKIIGLEAKKAAMESHGSQVKSQIQTECSALIDIIHEREVAMVAKVDKIVLDDTAMIQTFIDSSREKVKNANSCLAYAKEAAKEADPACFLQTEQLVRGRVEKSNGTLLNVEQYTHIPTDRVAVGLSHMKSLLEELDLLEDLDQPAPPATTSFPTPSDSLARTWEIPEPGVPSPPEHALPSWSTPVPPVVNPQSIFLPTQAPGRLPPSGSTPVSPVVNPQPQRRPLEAQTRPPPSTYGSTPVSPVMTPLPQRMPGEAPRRPPPSRSGSTSVPVPPVMIPLPQRMPEQAPTRPPPSESSVMTLHQRIPIQTSARSAPPTPGLTQVPPVVNPQFLSIPTQAPTRPPPSVSPIRMLPQHQPMQMVAPPGKAKGKQAHVHDSQTRKYKPPTG